MLIRFGFVYLQPRGSERCSSSGATSVQTFHNVIQRPASLTSSLLLSGTDDMSPPPPSEHASEIISDVFQFKAFNYNQGRVNTSDIDEQEL